MSKRKAPNHFGLESQRSSINSSSGHGAPQAFVNHYPLFGEALDLLTEVFGENGETNGCVGISPITASDNSEVLGVSGGLGCNPSSLG